MKKYIPKTFQKILSIFLVGGSIFSAGCSDSTPPKYSKYSFDGKIEDNVVKFYCNTSMGEDTEKWFYRLIVEKNDKDGFTQIKYNDYENEDLLIESAEVSHRESIPLKNSKELENKSYLSLINPEDYEQMELAQADFFIYLGKIIKEKQKLRQEKNKGLQELLE